MLSEKEGALEALKLETRKDLLQMKSAFSVKEAELTMIIKRQEEESKNLKKQVGGKWAN